MAIRATSSGWTTPTATMASPLAHDSQTNARPRQFRRGLFRAMSRRWAARYDKYRQARTPTDKGHHHIFASALRA